MITLTNDLKKAKFVTHAGNFHADDVFSTVFLNKLYKDITVIRLKEYKDDGTKLTYDIGLGKFDHHQAGYNKVRENGIHYCSFGLLWQEYGLEYLKNMKVANPEDTFKIFDYLLVNNIDAFDNGEIEINTDYNIYTIPSFIETMRPKIGEEEKENEFFLKATKVADFLFDKILEEACNKVVMIEKIKEQSKNIKSRVLILDEYIPYEFAIFYLNLDVDFVVYPSNRGGYAAHTIPTKYKGFISKVPFLSEWAGLRDEELQKVSGIKTARFCHNALFLFTTDTKEDALLAINKTVNKKD